MTSFIGLTIHLRFFGVFLGAAPAAGGCLPADETADGLRNLAVLYVSEAADRALADLPDVPADSISIVQEDSICDQAVAAYHARWGTPLETAVYVIRVGNRYLVRDPSDYSGDYGVVAVFRDDWEYVISLAV